MQFGELKNEIKEINWDTLRLDCDNRFEAVIAKGEVKKLIERLEKFFGAPVWPSKNRLSFQAEESIKVFGGIIKGQTLYFKNETKGAVFAMLWPWQDGERTTVKIVKE